MELDFEHKHKGLYRLIATIVHVLAEAHFLYANVKHFEFNIQFDHTHFERFGYHFKFLTTWGSVIQSLHYTYSLIYDIARFVSHLNEPPDVMVQIHAYSRSCFAFPMALVTCLTYWTFFMMNPDALYSKMEEAPPVYLRHMLHTNAVLLQMLDIMVIKCAYPNDIVCVLIVFFLYGAYVLWMCVIRIVTKQWVYPFYGRLSFINKIVVFIVFFVCFYICYKIGRFLNQFLWDDGPFEIENQGEEIVAESSQIFLSPPRTAPESYGSKLSRIFSKT